MTYWLRSDEDDGPDIEIPALDLKDFVSWLWKDVEYREKRSERRAEGTGDANVHIISVRRRLIRQLSELLKTRGKRRIQNEQPMSNHSQGPYGHRIGPTKRR